MNDWSMPIGNRAARQLVWDMAALGQRVTIKGGVAFWLTYRRKLQ